MTFYRASAQQTHVHYSQARGPCRLSRAVMT